MRLESQRAAADVKAGLDAVNTDLEKTAQALDAGSIKSAQDLDKVFAEADRELALAHRAKAAESWSHKAYDQAGYELKAAAHGLESAAAWTGGEGKLAAAAAVNDARALGDKLASGGVWAKDEVAKSFDALGSALDKIGLSLGAKTKAAPFDPGH